MTDNIDIFSAFRPKEVTDTQNSENPFQNTSLKRNIEETEEEGVSSDEGEEEEELFAYRDDDDDEDEEEEEEEEEEELTAEQLEELKALEEEMAKLNKPKTKIVTKLDISNPLVVSVSNLPFKLDDDGLRKFMSQFGKVKAAYVTMNKRRSTGYGLVEYKKDPAVKKAVEGSGTELEGRPITITESIEESTVKIKVKTGEDSKENDKTSTMAPSESLYAHNLNWPIDKEVLTTIFKSKYPNVKVYTGKRSLKNVEKGYAYIHFESINQSQKALKEFTNMEFSGKKLHLSFAKPQPKKKAKKEKTQTEE